MNKRFSISLLFGCSVLQLLTGGCGRETEPLHGMVKAIPAVQVEREEDLTRAPSLASLAGKQVSCLTGSVFDQELLAKVPSADPVYHKSLPIQVLALEAGRVDAMTIDEPVWKLLRHDHPFFRRCREMMSLSKYGIIVDPSRPELCARLNAFLAALRESGELEGLQKKWTSYDAAVRTMPPPPANGRAGILRVATVASLAPFSYYQDDRIVGYEIEILSRFASKEGYGITMYDVPFESLLVAVSTGKAAFGAAAVCITPERAKTVLFTDPDYVGGTVAVVNMQKRPMTSGSLTERVSTSFHRTFLAEHRYLKILNGLGITFLITFCAVFLGTTFGTLLCCLLRSGPAASKLTWLLVRLVQGTPIVVLLLVLYYIVFGQIDISAIVVAILAFTITFSASFATLLSGALAAVDPGQIEAARAMGFSRVGVYRYIEIPQALHTLLPAYAASVVALLKDSAIVGYIAIEDLTTVSDVITACTYEAFFPIFSTALIYILAAYLIIFLFTLLAKRLDPFRRARVLK